MGPPIIRLRDLPAHILAEGLVSRIYHDTMKAEGMNADGSLKVEMIPDGKVKEIADKYIDYAIIKANLKPGDEEDKDT